MPPNEFINEYQIRFEGRQGAGDDTALNGIIFRGNSFADIVNARFHYTIP